MFVCWHGFIFALVFAVVSWFGPRSHFSYFICSLYFQLADVSVVLVELVDKGFVLFPHLLYLFLISYQLNRIVNNPDKIDIPFRTSAILTIVGEHLFITHHHLALPHQLRVFLLPITGTTTAGFNVVFELFVLDRELVNFDHQLTNLLFVVRYWFFLENLEVFDHILVHLVDVFRTDNILRRPCLILCLTVLSVRCPLPRCRNRSLLRFPLYRFLQLSNNTLEPHCFLPFTVKFIQIMLPLLFVHVSLFLGVLKVN